MRHLVVLLGWLASARCVPPDKNIIPNHIIKTRSIDITNVHTLTLETQLDRNHAPSAYRLKLDPSYEEKKLQGEVSIDLTWLETTDRIQLHAAQSTDITDMEVKIMDTSSSEFVNLKVLKADFDIKKPIYTIKLEKEIPKGTKGQLDLRFNGPMDSKLNDAFCASDVQDSTMVATMFWPNKARRVFPCFDEPSYKATFELTLARPKTTVALSNTPIASTLEYPEKPLYVWDHFEPTPVMATYNLGFVVGSLAQLGSHVDYKDQYGNKLELRVWARQDYLSSLEAVPEKLTRVLKEIAAIWQVPLPLTRIDVVALPNFYGVKPVDNWGLIVFRESDLTGRGFVQLAQEICSQWLGAWASPAWWTDAHLTKALVGYLAAETAFKINDGSEMEGKWPMTVLYSLYYEYSKRFPHSRITGMKQETACTKIELLFRTFNYTIGGAAFKNGLKMFIDERKFKTFTGNDIWSALNSAAAASGSLPKDVDIKAVAETWISKDRLPVVTATRDYERKTVHLQQKVYLRERPHDVEGVDKLLWWIPLVIVRGDRLNFSNTTAASWIRNERTIALDVMPASDQFIIVNPEEIAPFPVNYDEQNWYLLLKFLQSEKRTQIPELTRAKLIHDAWNLAYSGQLSCATALNMTLFLKEERHHLVWDPVFTMIDHFGGHICQCIHGKFQSYVRSLLIPLYQDLVKDEGKAEEAWQKNLRSMSKAFLCKVGYKPCIEEAREHFHKWTEAESPDEGNPISNQFLCPVFKYGSREEWEFGLQRVLNFPASRQKSERTYLLKTLAGCPIDQYKVERLLNVTLLEDTPSLKEADIYLILSMMTSRPEGYTTLFHFIQKNWSQLHKKYSSKTNLWDNLITSGTSHFTTKPGLDLITKLYSERRADLGSSEHLLETSIRNVKDEVKWSSENLPVIEKWLDWYLANSNFKDDQYIKV